MASPQSVCTTSTGGPSGAYHRSPQERIASSTGHSDPTAPSPVAALGPLDWDLDQKAGYAYGLQTAHKLRRRAEDGGHDQQAMRQALLGEVDAAPRRIQERPVLGHAGR